MVLQLARRLVVLLAAAQSGCWAAECVVKSAGLQYKLQQWRAQRAACYHKALDT
jgi:hypothetical protein